MGGTLNISWWQWLPIHWWRIVGAVESADDVPKSLPRNAVVLVGRLDQPKWLVFDCPCRGGHRIMLNADKTRWPCWTIHSQKILTVHPSIDYRAPGTKRCHYIINNGQIIWVKDLKVSYE